MSDKFADVDALLREIEEERKIALEKNKSDSAVALKDKTEVMDFKLFEEQKKADKPEKTEDNDAKTMVVKKPEKAEVADEAKEEKTMVVKRPVKTEKPDTYKEQQKAKKRKKKDQGFNTSLFSGFFVAFGVVVIAFVIAIGGLSLGKEYLGIGKEQNDVTFNIPKGSTSSDIAEILEENNIIEHKLFFRLMFKFTAPDTIYPGDITLQPAMGYSAIIDQLATMRESYATATISFPEGVTLLDVANLLEENQVCTAEDFLFEFNKNQGYEFENQITDVENAFYEMEGYFFPDTYEFYLNDTGYNVVKVVRENFETKFTDKMYEKMKSKGLSLNQLMTLASMVQWEAGKVEDMPKVASVFMNRLYDPQTFPAFQSDATSRYIEKVIKVEADTTASLEHYTESYDTYNYKGLPAGPICNPGLDAINAVLNPADTDFYYFCNNLDTGKAYYAETLEEHEKNLVKAGLM